MQKMKVKDTVTGELRVKIVSLLNKKPKPSDLVKPGPAATIVANHNMRGMCIIGRYCCVV
jgi:hypothetical protein